MEKIKDLSEFIKNANKVFGENTVIKVGDKETPKCIMRSTGIMSIDAALGGGFGGGRIAEVVGMESSGKTSLALMTIAVAQSLGGNCAIVDTEQALDFEYAETLGVNLENLIVSQPDYGEQALEVLDNMVESGIFDVIVFDSVAAISPKSELEDEMGAQKIGLLARLMSQAMRKLTAKIKKTNTTVIFINQYREMIGSYVPTKVSTGGNALRFACSQRVEISKGTQIKDGDDILGGLMKVKVIKNKLFPPFRKTEVDMIFGKGVDKLKDTLNLAVKHEIIQKSGSWYAYGDTKLGQGIDKVRDLIADNPELLEEIEGKVKLAYLKR